MMVETVEMSKQQFLKGYADNLIHDVFGPITVNGEQRVYGKSTWEQGDNPDRYIVVYTVV